MISVRTPIFDTKEQKNNYASHSLEGIVLIMKPLLNKINNEIYQEIIEINLRFIVFY